MASHMQHTYVVSSTFFLDDLNSKIVSFPYVRDLKEEDEKKKEEVRNNARFYNILTVMTKKERERNVIPRSRSGIAYFVIICSLKFADVLSIVDGHN